MSHNKFQLPAALEAAIGHVQAVATAAAQRVVAQLADPGPVIPSPAERAARVRSRAVYTQPFSSPVIPV